VGFARAQGLGGVGGFASAQGTGHGFAPAQGVEGSAAAAAFSPSDVAGLALWLDGSDAATLYQDSARTTPVTADTDPVGGITDKSGQANHAAQTTANARPLYKTNIQNSKSALRFDGTNDSLTVADAAGLEMDTDSTVFLVVKNLTAEGNAGLVAKDNTNGVAGPYGLLVDASGKPQLDRPWIQAGVAATNAITTDAYVVMAKVSGTTVTHRRNGAANGTDTLAVGSTGNGSLFIGVMDALGVFLAFDLCELLVYSAPVADADRDLIESFLNTKWVVF
jgi:hypothetical protein